MFLFVYRQVNEGARVREEGEKRREKTEKEKQLEKCGNERVCVD